MPQKQNEPEEKPQSTTILRKGLILGKITSLGFSTRYMPYAESGCIEDDSDGLKTYVCHVALIKEVDGYSAIVLNLPGCGSQGDTQEEAITNVKESIAAVIESYVDMDMPLPWAKDYSISEDVECYFVTVWAASDEKNSR